MTRKRTTSGSCILCGSGSCMHWQHAALTQEGYVDAQALHDAHGVAPAIVHHDEDGKPIGGAVPLVPMDHAPSKSFTEHGGRIAPLPQRMARR